MKIVKYLFLLAVIAAGCKSNEIKNQDDVPLSNCVDGQPLSLKGTTWKLAGTVDTITGELKKIEPIDCERCYTLAFDTDSTATVLSIWQRLKLDLFNLKPDTFRNYLGFWEHYDKDKEPYVVSQKFRDAIKYTESYSATCDELKFFVQAKNYYLSFEPHFGENPTTSIVGTGWKLAGVVDTQTGNIKELEPKDCDFSYRCHFWGDYLVTFRSIMKGQAVNLFDHTIEPTDLGFDDCLPDQAEEWTIYTPAGMVGDGKAYEDSIIYRWGILNMESYEITHDEFKIFFTYLEKHYYLSFKCEHR